MSAYTPGNRPSLREVGAGTKAGALKELCLLAVSGAHSALTVQVHHHRDGAAHSRLGLPRSIISETVSLRSDHR